MKKYLYYIAGTVVTVGVLMLGIDVSGADIPIWRVGTPITFNAGCKTAAGNAIASVYPTVPIGGVHGWACERTATDEATPNEWYCSGSATVTVSVSTWFEWMQDGKIDQQPAINGSNVDVMLRMPPVMLNAAQKAAHGPLITCIGISASDLTSFRLRRDGSDVIADYQYATTVSTQQDVLDLAVANQLIKILEEAP